MTVYGVNPVLEALRAQRVERVVVVGGTSPRLDDVVREARARGIPVEVADRAVLDRLSRGGVHQGVAAIVAGPVSWELEDLVAAARPPALIVVLDGIEDPQNLGAILRTVDAAGADGVVQQTRRAAPLGGAAAKASAGAMAHVRVARVVNVARALDQLKEAGVWTVGLASEAERSYDQVDLTGPIALVLGAEGTGLRRLVRERCDWLCAVPMRGHVESLNVSVAAGVVLYEALRQRRTAGTSP
jgi:23S rRNA (guanosine2251-2'-O)-methyltransferase